MYNFFSKIYIVNNRIFYSFYIRKKPIGHFQFIEGHLNVTHIA